MECYRLGSGRRSLSFTGLEIVVANERSDPAYAEASADRAWLPIIVLAEQEGQAAALIQTKTD